MGVSAAGSATTALNPTVMTAALVTVLLCTLVAAAALVLIHRRHRRRIETLLGRLADFEKRTAEDSPEPAGTGPGEVPLDQLPDPDREAVERLVGQDPLAGRTSHVRRVVEGSRMPSESLADQAIACIHGHLAETVTAGMMAEELFVSIRTLERGIAAALDCTPSQLITAMKMREARRLLASGRYRVNEVAAQLAFSTPQYFSRRFKSFYGVSPSRFARDHGGPE